MSVNLIYLVGRLGKDPELVSFQNGSHITKLSIATSERWIDKSTGKPREQTEWHQVVVPTAMSFYAFKHLTKGSLVIIEGSLRYPTYHDVHGVKMQRVEVWAKTLKPL